MDYSKTRKYGGTLTQYMQQLRLAEIFMAELTKRLEAQGYVNTIHDCWEKPDDNRIGNAS